MTQQEIINSSMLKVGTILHGTYRIDSYLSSGGFGNTYVATNVEFDERVAIKEFFMKGVTQRDDNQTTVSVSNTDNKDSFLAQREKFKKEARRIRQLKNDHIVAVHDLFEENGTAYYVMDYVDGESLSERMKHTGKPLSEQEVREILPQILDALKAVHDAGIWHLDLKPANIMLEKGGNIKLIDFGASKQLNAQKGGATTSTAISYTNGYAPREQMEQNYDKFGPWTDIYALGATLYNLLTNKRPPLPSDIDDDDSNDKHQSLSFPDGVNDYLKKMVLQLMQTNRKRRPQTIDEASAILKQQPSRSEETEEKPVQITVEEAEDSEETIIATPKSESTVVEKRATSEPNTTPKPSPKVENIIESDDSSENSSVWKIVITIAVGIVAIILIYNGGLVRGNDAQEPAVQQVENTGPKTVERMPYKTDIGEYQYSGPVDDNNKPHGRGEAFFNDGRYYKGGFVRGSLSGANCYFRYAEGDTFEGTFLANRFYNGKYTIASDKSYYIGDYDDKGQPSSGTWYNKKGKVISKI